MAAVEEVNSTLASKCMDFCQALASQGHVFNFSLAIGPDFSFSLDTRSKVLGLSGTKKKASPSTLRRNAKRREEFNQRKQKSLSARISTEGDASEAPKCDHCDYEAASEKGLRQHVRMKHKTIGSSGQTRSTPLATPESFRKQDESSSSLTSSPLCLKSREENCQNCEGPFSPGHQCGYTEHGIGCSCSNLDCCACNHVESCHCYKHNKQTEVCDCKGVEEGSSLGCPLMQPTVKLLNNSDLQAIYFSRHFAVMRTSYTEVV